MKMMDWLLFGMIFLGIVFIYVMFHEAGDIKRWTKACENINKQEDFCKSAQALCAIDFTKYNYAGQ